MWRYRPGRRKLSLLVERCYSEHSELEKVIPRRKRLTNAQYVMPFSTLPPSRDRNLHAVDGVNKQNVAHVENPLLPPKNAATPLLPHRRPRPGGLLTLPRRLLTQGE